MKFFKRLIILFINLVFLFAILALFVLEIQWTKLFTRPEPEPEPGPSPSEELQVLRSEFLNRDDGLIDIVVQMHNPNIDWGAERISYNIFLLDSRDNVLDELSGEWYILPTEKKFLVLTAISAPRGVSDVQFEMEEIEWRQLEAFWSLNLNIAGFHLDTPPPPSPFNVRLAASVLNTSSFGLTNVDVVGVLLDVRDNILAVNRTRISSLLEGEQRGAELFWRENIPTSRVSRIEVAAYSNVLKNETFIRSYGKLPFTVIDQLEPPADSDPPTRYFELPEIFDRFRIR